MLETLRKIAMLVAIIGAIAGYVAVSAWAGDSDCNVVSNGTFGPDCGTTRVATPAS